MHQAGTLIYEVDGPVATITLNRPDKLNAVNSEMVRDLDRCLSEAAGNDDVKVVLLKGAGRAFSAGYDINDEMEAGTDTALEWQPVLQRDLELTMKLWSLPKPTIAVVRGYCLAGGCELAMACDMILAAEDAQFGEPEIQYGSGPVTLIMPFIIGQKKTNELLFTGDKISADEAYRLGMVNHVVPGEGLDAAAAALALRIAPTPLEVLRLTKRALTRAYEAQGLGMAVASNLEISCLINGANTPEQQEFDSISRTQGLKAALAWRDSRYGTPRSA